MNKKGFTLVEVLGVMVIIVTLSLIILPNIINRFSNKKEDISSTNKEILVSAAKLYVSDKKEELSDYLTYCVDINELIKNKYLSEKKDVFSDTDYASNHKVKVTIGKPNEYEVVESSSCKSLTPYDTGNKIIINNMDFHVISNYSDYVVLFLDKPLTGNELNKYGVGHINQYTESWQGRSKDFRDPNYSGGMVYYSSADCGYDGSKWKRDNCKTDYNESEIKYIVDAWATDKFKNNELKEVDGYRSRLITKNELLKYYSKCTINLVHCDKDNLTPPWIWDYYNSEYWYWTMTPVNNDGSIGIVDIEGNWDDKNVSYSIYYRDTTPLSHYGAVRPVINVYKSAIQQINAE